MPLLPLSSLVGVFALLGSCCCLIKEHPESTLPGLFTTMLCTNFSLVPRILLLVNKHAGF